MKLILLAFCLIGVMFSATGQACPKYFPSITLIDRQLNKGLVAEPASSPKIFIRCGGTKNSVAIPLFVVDGIVVNEIAIQAINPTDIQEIYILKDGAATAIYGCRASNGVIVIVTRRTQHRSFVVRNANSLMSIPAATIRAESMNQKNAFTFTADEFGRIETDSLKSLDYEFSISAAGYHSKTVNLTQILKNKGEILLEKDALSQSQRNSHTGVRIYPNSVDQGGMIHLSFLNAKTGVYYVRIFTASGQLIEQVQKTIMKGATERMQLGKAIVPGMSIIQVLDEKYHVLETAKLMVR